MEKITVRLAKEHEQQINRPDVKAELDNVQNMITNLDVQLTAQTVYLVFCGGNYSDYEKKMTSVLVFINNTEKTLKAFRSVVRLRSQIPGMQIATTTVAFDHTFLGDLRPQEGVLVHLNIPVKGLVADKALSPKEITGEMSDVEIAYVQGEE